MMENVEKVENAVVPGLAIHETLALRLPRGGSVDFISSDTMISVCEGPSGGGDNFL